MSPAVSREKVLAVLRDEYTDGRPVWDYYEAIESRIRDLRSATQPAAPPIDVERLAVVTHRRRDHPLGGACDYCRREAEWIAAEYARLSAEARE